MMATGRSQPSIVIDIQVLVTHAASVATMEPEMGHPPRIIRGPDMCDRFQARDAEGLPGLMDRWASYGIAAQVVQISPTGGQTARDNHPTPLSCQVQVGRDISTPATGLVHKTGPRMALLPTGETRMRSTTDHVHERRAQTAPPPTDARGPEGTMYAPPETEASFEEIKR
jgi:hypothetical protein